MSSPDFQHLRLSMVNDVAVVEIRTKDLQGPVLARELSAELALGGRPGVGPAAAG